MTRKGCIWGWLIGVLALLVIFVVTIVAIESVLGQRLSFPTYGARVGLIRVEGGIYDSRQIIADLENMKREYLARLKSLVETHLRVLESMEEEDESYKKEPQLAGSRRQPKSNSDEEMKI